MIISNTGLKRILAIDKLPPLIRTFATETEKEKIISEIASSIPTTAKIVEVNGPFALYWFKTTTVAAGAVAEATAPRTKAWYNLSGYIKYIPMETNKKAETASKKTIKNIDFPSFWNTDFFNSEPIVKAIAPNAKSFNISTSLINCWLNKPTIDFPKITPNKTYPTTMGKFNLFVIL